MVLSCEKEGYIDQNETSRQLSYFENQTESIRLRQEKEENEELEGWIRILRPLTWGNSLAITSIMLAILSLSVISYQKISDASQVNENSNIIHNGIMSLIKTIVKGEYEVILALFIAMPIVIRLFAAFFLHFPPRFISFFVGKKLSRRSSIYEGGISHQFRWANEYARSPYGNKKNRTHHIISYLIVSFFVWRLDFLNRIRSKKSHDARQLSRWIIYGSYFLAVSTCCSLSYFLLF